MKAGIPISPLQTWSVLGFWILVVKLQTTFLDQSRVSAGEQRGFRQGSVGLEVCPRWTLGRRCVVKVSGIHFFLLMPQWSLTAAKTIKLTARGAAFCKIIKVRGVLKDQNCSVHPVLHWSPVLYITYRAYD